MIKISEEPTKFDFGSLLKKEKKKEEEKQIDDSKLEIEEPLGTVIDSADIPEIVESEKLHEEIFERHPIVQEFTATMDAEAEKTRLGEEIIERIESLEKNYDLEFMQKLITIKNVLNYTQSSWSFGVCKEILDGISIRGKRKKIASGLILTIKKMAKLG